MTPPRHTKIRVPLALRMVNAAYQWFRCKITKFSARPQYSPPQFSIPISIPFSIPGPSEPSRAPPNSHCPPPPDSQPPVPNSKSKSKHGPANSAFRKSSPSLSHSGPRLCPPCAPPAAETAEGLKNQTLQPNPAWYSVIFEQTLKS